MSALVDNAQNIPTANSNTLVASTAPETQEERFAKARIASGATFLRAAEKKNASLAFRINFLKSKGFTADEIFKCFESVGFPQTMESIMKHMHTPPVNSNVQTSQGRPINYPASPYFSPIPPPPEGLGWKDVFIATTLIGAAGYAAYRAASTWLPWEIVLKKKGEESAPRRKKERKEKLHENDLSRTQESACPSPTDKIEAPRTEPASQPAQQIATIQEEEVKSLKAEVADKIEQVSKIMREKADMTVKIAQLRSQQTQTARTLENANKKIAELEAALAAKEIATKADSKVIGDAEQSSLETQIAGIASEGVAQTSVNEPQPVDSTQVVS